MKALERIAQYIEWRIQTEASVCYLVVEKVREQEWRAELRTGSASNAYIFREYAESAAEAVESLATNVLLPERS